MSVANPIFGTIPRQSVVGMENEWVKMFDPPKASPETPEWLNPTNPVPEVMAAASLQKIPGTSHTVQRDLLHGVRLSTWDSRTNGLIWFVIRDGDNPSAANGTYPAPTTRIPRGCIFHGETQGHGPPPHTIHWHGIEPTPINDGVGHCSMEIGHYTYQSQPNFIGTYFYHCHRNTVQHFNYGLYGLLPIMPSDAFFATQWDSTIPIGAGRDRKYRTAANLSLLRGPTGGGVAMDPGSGAGFEGAIIANPYPGWVGGLLTDPDPEANNANLPAYLKFQTNPHAMTVPYDIEAIWVLADRDSKWSDEMPDARATFPKAGGKPGIDDRFSESPGVGGCFAFNQFNPDYWFVTGVPVPAHRGGTGRLPAVAEIPAALNSGMAGVQVPISAEVGQTIFLRMLNGAYDCADVTFPCDVTIIEWDGRALGVPPFGFNHPYKVPAGTPIHTSVARRFGALIRSDVEVHGVATVKFISANKGGHAGMAPVVMTAEIPINLGPPAFNVSGKVANAAGASIEGVTVTLAGGTVNKTAVTDVNGNYSIRVANGTYTVTPSLSGFTFAPANASVTVAGAALTQNFTGTQGSTYIVSGTVVTSQGAVPIPGATVTLSGDASATALTNAAGDFIFAGVHNGDYVVSVSLAGFRFRPIQKTVSVRGGNKMAGIFRGRSPA